MLAGYAARWPRALRGRGFRGALLGWAALTVGSAGAALGGHMAYHQAMGANHAEGYPHIGPGDWTDVGTVDDLPEGEPTRRIVGDVGVLVVRRGERIHALADRCAHASAPLHEGRITNGDGPDVRRLPLARQRLPARHRLGGARPGHRPAADVPHQGA